MSVSFTISSCSLRCMRTSLLPCISSSSLWKKSRIIQSFSSSPSSDMPSSSSFQGPNVCIVGSGPAGFYTADALLKMHPSARITILEKLPTPYGLVRYGVAPDHPEVKVVSNKFESVATNERVQFLGNVTVGKDISLPELQSIYDAVVLAYGASADRSLGIEGENLNGVCSAASFVRWYNGHPEADNNAHNGLTFEKLIETSHTVVIIGQGNVALDVGRLLTKPVGELAPTDCATYALNALKKSSVKHVVLVGRRGPAQAAFTTKELRELTTLPNVKIVVREDEVELNEASKIELETDRAKKRLVDLLFKSAEKVPTPSQSSSISDEKKKILEFRFLQSPAKLIGNPESGKVSAIVLKKNQLTGEPGHQKAVELSDPPVEETIDCQFVLRSIGYKGISIKGAPFDAKSGTVPNDSGRVIDPSLGNAIVQGLYVTGWLKRGPSGIILTNKICGEETADCVACDLERKEHENQIISNGGVSRLMDLLKQRQCEVVEFDGWKRLDVEEKRRGEVNGRIREKVVDKEEMMSIARKSQ